MLALPNLSVRVVCVWALLFPSIAAAEPIVIRSGAIEVGERFTARPFAVSGDRRFSLSGIIGNRGLDPLCGGERDFTCAPGLEATLAFNWGGLDFTGVDATLDGVTYREINTSNSNTFASINVSGTVLLPQTIAGTAVLQAPFFLEGLFISVSADGEHIDETLRGSGTMTATWTGITDPEIGPRWALSFSRFEFADPAPIPEPGTLVLGGAAAAVAAISRRRRCRKDSGASTN